MDAARVWHTKSETICTARAVNERLIFFFFIQVVDSNEVVNRKRPDGSNTRWGDVELDLA